ncbi:MAG: hypothetical protein M1814_006596 [Vezdaea aestivalis]|nr:MAG: hypothetical protein M1814_006596 [Vezdaea aestivalis]
MQPYSSSFDHYQPPYGMVPHSNPYSPQSISHGGLSPYQQASQYAVQPLAHSGVPQDPSASRKRGVGSVYGPYGNGTLGSTMNGAMPDGRRHSPLAGSAPVRRRISRACDQCNQLRTRCDGNSPCAHCQEFNLTCEYNRERKKRGKASRKDRQQKEAQDKAAANGSIGSLSPSAAPSQSNSPSESAHGHNASPASMLAHELPASALTYSRSMSVGGPYTTSGMADSVPITDRAGSMGNIYDFQGAQMAQDGLSRRYATHSRPSPLSVTAPELRLDVMGDAPQFSRPSYQDDSDTQMMSAVTDQSHINSAYPISAISQPYASSDYPIVSPHTNDQQHGFVQPIMSSTAPNGFLGATASPASPSWVPASQGRQPNNQHVFTGIKSELRYPVLAPLLDYIESIIPTSLACDLLDLYFTSSSSTFTHSLSPFVIGNVFRRQSVLHPVRPRRTSPALLASMLLVAAQTSEAPALTKTSHVRGDVCQKLLEVAVDLLNPLNHGIEHAQDLRDSTGVGLGLGHIDDANASNVSPTDEPASLDDIVTYVHLATVMSNSKLRAASLRWWTAAFTLAKELKFNIEVASTSQDGSNEEDAEGEVDFEIHDQGSMTEEAKEERRRVWWLLYIADRHLAFCCNRSLALLDSECTNLLHPIDDEQWQSSGASSSAARKAGRSTECSGRSTFGYILPLMAILGDIVTLKHLRSNPYFANDMATIQFTENLAASSESQLMAYSASLNSAFPSQGLDHETNRVVSHASLLVEVMHILIHSSWDPVTLLDSVNTKSFASNVKHAVTAANILARSLESDPKMSFMPFFTGPYVLHAGFVLLAVAEQNGLLAVEGVGKSLDTCARALEVSRGLLQSTHQKFICNSMRSAHSKISGKLFKSTEDSQRQREVLQLYRWTPEGTGLAL